MAPSDELLAQIPGSDPGGADVRYDPVYEKIKEARREDVDAPQGAWVHARKLADWPVVEKLCTEVLTKRSKDIQAAAWLTEALLRREGFAGLRKGLELLRGLLDSHWEHLYPRLEDGDASMRAAPLLWLGIKLDVAVKSVPLTQSGLTFIDHDSSRKQGYESAVGDDYERQQAWKKAMDEGLLSADAFDAAVGATSKGWYKTLVADINGATTALKQLEETSDKQFSDDPPAYTGLRRAIEEVAHVAEQILAQKLEQDPDPVDVMAVDDTAGSGRPGGAASSGPTIPDPTDKDDAAGRVISAARFLRRLDPTDPTPYLMLRALRWGELRAGGPQPNPRLLQPPPAQARVQLRTLFLDNKWPELLEAAETIMGTPAGRGWVDLQRYALLSCTQLGDDFSRVARALRSELRVLFEEVPDLAGMTLMDDMPAATGETRAWLAEMMSASAAASAPVAVAEGDTPASAPAPIMAPMAPPVDRVHAQALGEVRAGRPERAVEILMRELERETSPRSRFIRQAQLASIMLDASMEAVAKPILEDMLRVIENHGLETWELGSMVAQPIGLMYRCLERMNGSDSQREDLYLRICRLDPLKALEFKRPA